MLESWKPKSNFSSRERETNYVIYSWGKFLKLVRISPWRRVSSCLEIKLIINRERDFGCGIDSDTQMPSNPASEENLASEDDLAKDRHNEISFLGIKSASLMQYNEEAWVGVGARKTWVQVLPLLLISYMNLSKYNFIFFWVSLLTWG